VEKDNTGTVLEDGDEIEIVFHYWPEIGTITQNIRPDGKISLPYKKEIQAAGLTAQQLTDELVSNYSDLLKDPSITVIVKTLANREIYVGGEVWAPGKFPLKNKMTVLQAVMAAGGFRNNSAAPDNVVLIRHHENKRYVTTINLNDAIEGTNTEPYYLAARDIVFVPQTTISKINLWVDQYLTKILTVSGFSFSYYPNDEWTLHVGGTQ